MTSQFYIGCDFGLIADHSAVAVLERTERKGESPYAIDVRHNIRELRQHPATAWLNDVSSVSLQQSLRDLQAAFSAFFAKRSGYPSFKKKSSRATARYVRSAFSFRHRRRLELAKVGVLRIRWDRILPSDPSSVTIIREPSGRYFVSFVVDVSVDQLPKTGASVGVDFGIARLATLSDGSRIANPKYLIKRARRLAFLQKRLSRKQKSSKRRMLAKRAVARQHEKIANCRKDALNKFTTKLVIKFDTICIEDLNLRGMVKNHNLARSLSDAGIGMAVRMLEEKAERYGKTVTKIDRWFPSSKLCSECGCIASAMPLSIRDWTCANCDAHHDRDGNAAMNILVAGQAMTAHGCNVRPAMISVVGGSCR